MVQVWWVYSDRNVSDRGYEIYLKDSQLGAASSSAAPGIFPWHECLCGQHVDSGSSTSEWYFWGAVYTHTDIEGMPSHCIALSAPSFGWFLSDFLFKIILFVPSIVFLSTCLKLKFLITNRNIFSWNGNDLGGRCICYAISSFQDFSNAEVGNIDKGPGSSSVYNHRVMIIKKNNIFFNKKYWFMLFAKVSVGVCAKLRQSCPTLCDCTLSSVHGILQARMLKWVCVPSSRGSSQPRDRICGSCIAGGFSTPGPPGKPIEILVFYQLIFVNTLCRKW